MRLSASLAGGRPTLARMAAAADDARVPSDPALSSPRALELALSAALLSLLGASGCGQVLGLGDFTDDPGTGGAGASSSASDGSTNSSSGSTTGPSSGSGASTGAGGAGCGDGEIQPPEECDDGPSNGPGQACKLDCTSNICGDGDVGPEENCDEGAENGLGLLKCAPDCSRVIVDKQIVISSQMPNGSFGGANPVDFADSHCPAGYKALFAFGNLRRATTVGNEVTNPVDWVLAPYTYYYNSQSNPVWLTDDVALLGVRDGAFVGLENPIRPLVTENSISGLTADWTTLGSDNCNGWTNLNSGSNKSVGWTFADDISFIVDATLSSCSASAVLYCVEQ